MKSFVETGVTQESDEELVRLRKEHEDLLTFVQQFSQTEVVSWTDTEHYFDPRRMYMCPFCTPGEAGEPNEGEHAPDCLVMQAQQFLEKRKVTQA